MVTRPYIDPNLPIDIQITLLERHKHDLVVDLEKQKWRKKEITLWLENVVNTTVTQRENEIRDINERVARLNEWELKNKKAIKLRSK